MALAAVLGALRIMGKKPGDISVVINGAGAAGIATARLLNDCGIGSLIVCDRAGALYNGRSGLSAEKQQIAETTNRQSRKGLLADVMPGADIFIGVSAAGCVTGKMIESMNKGAAVFTLANPIPEIMPDLAKKAGAAIIGTGRSDFPNQINNALAFPGIFKGALSACAADIDEKMKIAAAKAIAGHISDAQLSEDNIIPSPLDRSVAVSVAQAVLKAAPIEKNQP